MAQKCAWIIYSHNSPSKLYSFPFQRRWGFDYIQQFSHVLGVFTRGVSFRLLCGRPWHFGIRNTPFISEYDAVSPTFYNAMKIQPWRSFMGFQAGVFPLIFSPYIRGGGGGRGIFPIFLNLQSFNEAVQGALISSFISVFWFLRNS